MKRLIVFIFLLHLSCSLSVMAQVHVKGHFRRNGTYVQPYERTRPNNTATDNYSYPGNYNPNTGRITGGTTPTYSSPAYSAPTYRAPSSSVETYIPTETTPATAVYPITETRAQLSRSVRLYAILEANAALKRQPHYSAVSMYAIPAGTQVSISEYDEFYYRAEVTGYVGYVCKCQVKRTYTE